jgi:phospholipase D1/2
LIGWDLDTRVRLADEHPDPEVPLTLGPLLSFLSRRRPELKIYVMAWDEGLLSVPARGTTAFRLLRWRWDGVTMKWDSTHPLNASHHQKILVVDDCVGFCGGIDITADRWDTRDHKDGDPGRKRPFTGRFYGPWHDATMALEGPAARALGDLARKRWAMCAGSELKPAQSAGDCWPDGLEVGFHNVPVAIARTRAKVGEHREVREIEALFVEMIGAARKRIYIETQYFASRVVAKAIVERLEDPDGPEIIVINPRTGQYWLDEGVMGPARYHLLQAVRARDPHNRFRIYSPVTDGSQDIYVHAKVMIIDHIFLRVGSANLNNRSMGLDSECDVVIDARNDETAQARIAKIQCDLLAEHLGVTEQEFGAALEEEGSLIAAIEALRGHGRTLWPLEPARPGLIKSELSLSEALDPEGPDDKFEPPARPGLLSRLGRGRRH